MHGLFMIMIIIVDIFLEHHEIAQCVCLLSFENLNYLFCNSFLLQLSSLISLLLTEIPGKIEHTLITVFIRYDDTTKH